MVVTVDEITRKATMGLIMSKAIPAPSTWGGGRVGLLDYLASHPENCYPTRGKKRDNWPAADTYVLLYTAIRTLSIAPQNIGAGCNGE